MSFFNLQKNYILEVDRKVNITHNLPFHIRIKDSESLSTVKSLRR